MSSNFERLHEIIYDAYAENFSCVSHWEPKKSHVWASISENPVPLCPKNKNSVFILILKKIRNVQVVYCFVQLWNKTGAELINSWDSIQIFYFDKVVWLETRKLGVLSNFHGRSVQFISEKALATALFFARLTPIL